MKPPESAGRGKIFRLIRETCRKPNGIAYSSNANCHRVGRIIRHDKEPVEGHFPFDGWSSRLASVRGYFSETDEMSSRSLFAAWIFSYCRATKPLSYENCE